MENTVKERLKQYLRINRITQEKFCNSVGVAPTYVSNIRKGIQPDKLARIQECYPDLNIEWLVTGKGDMLNSSPKAKDAEIELTITQLYKDNLRMAEEIGRLKAELNYIKNKP